MKKMRDFLFLCKIYYCDWFDGVLKYLYKIGKTLHNTTKIKAGLL